MSKKALLMILDGWGLGDQKKDDVIFNTPTPYWDYRQNLFQLFHFIQFHRCPCIPFNTTFALAGVQITKELFPKDIEAHYYIFYLNHKTYVRQKGRSIPPPLWL